MKRVLSLMLTLVLIIGLFSGCGKKIIIDDTNVSQVVISNGSATSTLTNKNEIASLLTMVNQEKKQKAPSEGLPEITYSFTTFNGETDTNTVTLYGENYMQINKTLYTVSPSITEFLSNKFILVDLAELSDFFLADAETVEEIAFYHLKDETFKIITEQADIESFMKTVQGITMNNSSVKEPTEAYKVLYRCQGETEYHDALWVSTTADKKFNLLSCGEKSCTVNAIDWARLYNKMKYNKMP
jgi:hypothetical protein